MNQSLRKLMLATALFLQFGWLGSAMGMTCDVDSDRDVDRSDLTLLQQAILQRKTVTGPDDPRDADANGLINSADGRICALRCTRSGCATNWVPVANAGEDLTGPVGKKIILDGSASTDADGQSLGYTWSFVSRPAGSAATLDLIDPVRPTFVIDRPGSYVLRLVVSDGIASSPADEVIVSTVNSAPVANAGADQSSYTGHTVNLDGSASSDVDGDVLSYAWSFAERPAGSTASLVGAASVTPSFIADVYGTYRVQLVVNDGSVASVADEVVVSLDNTTPVANAGRDQSVVVGQIATLDGSASTDIDGQPLSYAWAILTHPAGSSATLSDVVAVKPTFVIDALGTYVAQLIVNDGLAGSAADTVVITSTNVRPVANAGPDQSAAVVGSTVQLDGSASHDVDGHALTFSWAIVSAPVGSGATLSNPAAVRPTFVMDAYGTYVVQLMVSDGYENSTADQVVVTALNRAPVANAGPDQSVAQGQLTVLNGSASSDPDGTVLSYAWSFVSRPAGSAAVLANANTSTPSFSTDVAGDYVLQLIVSDGDLASAPDTVTVSTLNVRPVANAGADQSGVLVGTAVSLDGSASSDANGDPLSYSWSFASRPAGSAATLTGAGSAIAGFVPDVGGTYLAQLIVNDGHENSLPDSAVVEVVAGNGAPFAAADRYEVAEDGSLVVGAPGVLSNDNDPDGDVLSARLITPPASGSLGLGAAGGFSFTPAADFNGDVFFVYRANDGKADSADARVDITVTPVNDAPIANAGSDQSVTQGSTVVLSGAGSDIDGDVLTYHWTLSTPAGSTAALSDAGIAGPSFVADLPGRYQASLVVNDGVADSAAAVVTINVSPVAVNTAPVAWADSYQVAEGQTLTVAAAGVLANDKDAEGDALTAELVSAPAHGSLSLSPSGGFSYQPAAAFAGVDQFTYRARDAALASAPVTVEIIVTPFADVLPLDLDLTVTPKSVAAGGSVSISVAARGGSGSVGRGLSVDGSAVALSAAGTATITGVTAGTHKVLATVTDAAGSVTKESYFAARVDGDTVAPTVAITSPVADAELYGSATIIGTASDANLAEYRLYFAPAGTTQYTQFARGTTSVTAGNLANFDITSLGNGFYDIRLEATDVNGNTAAIIQTVEVIGDQKVGNFDLSFEDLSVEAVGIPVRVTRSYSTRRKAEALDFGYGWSVGYQDLQIRKNMVLGLSWNVVRQSFNLCLRPAGKRKVSITLPDGSLQRFEAKNATDCAFATIPEVNIQFTPLAGTTSTLEAINIPTLMAQGGQIYDMDNVEPWNPKDFKLTAEDGTQYYLQEGKGIVQVKDAYGNTLTYGTSGIVHSAGQSVAFQRDAKGRITRITDPAGKAIVYTYNANGDLASVTNRNNETAYFRYNRSHGLVDFTDPRGVLMLRNVYDDEGRLIAQYDAAGNKVELSHDTASQKETVKNRRGYSTTYTYDTNGDVTEVLDALGNTTRYTYDALGNETSTTDPLGNVVTRTFNATTGKQLTETDALGNITSFGYSGYKLTSTTDPLGNVTNYGYWGEAPTSITEPLGRVTSMGYSASGNLTSLSIAGQTTTYGYDAKGNRISETDAAGNVTTYTYDGNGHETARSYQRTTAAGIPETITLTRVVDSEGRVIEESDALGGITRTSYNSAGKPTQVTDPLGRTTYFSYDAQARLIATRYPDGTGESIAYDANGNEVERSDRAGRTTRQVYDALDRLVQTVYPDGSSEATEYDAAGRVVASIDARGNRTANAYDAVGRLVQTTDATGGVARYEYDANGNRTKATDALGRVTLYEYDALNRLVKTTLPGGAFRTTVWRTDGRKQSETDETGNTTSYGYDALGRLTQVTQTAGTSLITAYGYDELGNKVSQTDAEGRVTRWSYDATGRPVTRTMPNGAVEHFEYDVAGNVTAHTGFDGRRTQYAYDSSDRRILTVYPDGSTLALTYTATGQVASQTDGRGTTRITRDVLDRPLRIDQPDGSFLAYTYDAAGNIIARETPSGTTAYAYDGAGRLTQVTDTQGKPTAYTWAADGQPTRIVHANGTETRIEYEADGRVRQQADIVSATQAVINATRYTLASGLRVKAEVFDSGSTASGTGSLTLANPANSRAYEYDGAGRLVKETLTVRGSSDTRVTTYAYDRAGNRTSRSVVAPGVNVTTSYSYDTNDRLIQESRSSGGSIAYAWDANGNLIKKTEAGQVTLYAWDAENRLIEVKRGATEAGAVVVASYLYDADGNRVQKTEPLSGKVTQYLVDGSFPFAQVLEEKESLGAATETTQYVWGTGLLKQIRGGQGSYYHADALGSVKALTNEAGSQTDSYEYEAFGELASHAGTTANPYRYTGEHYDDAISLQYNRARWYDANAGRWLSQDPHPGVVTRPGTLNKYGYASGDPTTYSDPSGMFIGIVSISMDSISGAYARAANAENAYQRFNSIRNSLCKGVDSVGDVVRHGHHLIPKFLGGKEQQDLMMLSPTIHHALHGLLNIALVANGFPFANQGRKQFEKFMSANPGKRGERDEIVLNVVGYMDKMCKGVAGYNEIKPEVEQILKIADIFDF